MAHPFHLLFFKTLTMASFGTVKGWNEDRGYGLITPDDGSADVFAYVKECPDMKGAQPGDAVTYDTKRDDRPGKEYKGTYACNVTRTGGGGGGGGGKGGGKGYPSALDSFRRQAEAAVKKVAEKKAAAAAAKKAADEKATVEKAAPQNPVSKK